MREAHPDGVDAVAARYGVSPHVVRSWADRGLVPVTRVGSKGERRFDQADLDHAERMGLLVPGKEIPIKYRILKNIKIDDNGCWIWQGKPAPNGYGRISVKIDGRNYTRGAHRVSYQAFKGPISDELDIDHLCRVRPCVNPDHLEAVTARINILRGVSFTAENSRKTHCKRNHPYNEENSYRNKRGLRVCRACGVIYARERRDRLRPDRIRRPARPASDSPEVIPKRADNLIVEIT